MVVTSDGFETVAGASVGFEVARATAVDKPGLRKVLSPGKAQAIKLVKNIQGPDHTSTPQNPEQSKTEDGRRVLAGNIESIQAITNTIRSLQIERAEFGSQNAFHFGRRL